MIGSLPTDPSNCRPRRLRSLFLVLTFAAVLAAVLPGSAQAQTEDDEAPDSSILPVSYWQQKFDAVDEETHRENLPLSTSSNSWDFYQLAYGIDAYTSMFEATGQTQYADRALEYVENMVESAQPSSSLGGSRYGDDFLGWASQRSDTAGEEVPLFESYCWRYATRLLRVIRDNPATFHDPAYRERYERLLAFAERNIFDKWHSRGVEEHMFRNRTHMASHWAYIALDLSVLTPDAVKRQTYRGVFDAINRGLPNYDSSLRDQLRLDERAYVWSSQWDDGKPQDVAHGNNMMAFIVEARDLGQEWTDEDISRFIATLTQNIWPKGGDVAEYVDGSGDGNGWLSDGFVKLGRYDPALQRRLQDHDVQGAQFFAAMAVNAQRLAAGPTTPPRTPPLRPRLTTSGPIVGG